tara:strand:- start:59262 stop:60152 length:891 start_codon:yes stop_codon:yes gene_type:complete
MMRWSLARIVLIVASIGLSAGFGSTESAASPRVAPATRATAKTTNTVKAAAKKKATGQLKYRKQPGGRVKLRHGAIVEGSARHGGMQPDYHINFKHPKLARILKKASMGKKTRDSFWSRVAKVQSIVSDSMPRTDYDDRVYLNLLATARTKAKPISLGEYPAHKVGVCREYAMITHLALAEAGIPSEFVYGKVAITDRGDSTPLDHGEDHGIVLVKYRGKEWIVDTYFSDFNGHSLKEAQGGISAGSNGKRAPHVEKHSERNRKFIKVNAYPTYHLPVAGGAQTRAPAATQPPAAP